MQYWIAVIDNHDSGYLGIAVQLYVQAYLGHYHIFDPEGIQPKTDGTAEIYAPFYLYMHNLNFWKLVESTIQPHVKVHNMW